MLMCLDGMYLCYLLVFGWGIELNMRFPMKLLSLFEKLKVHLVRIWIIFWFPKAQAIPLRIRGDIYDFVIFFGCFVVFYDIMKRPSPNEAICFFLEIFEYDENIVSRDVTTRSPSVVVDFLCYLLRCLWTSLIFLSDFVHYF